MFNEEELKLIRGCLLTTKETFELLPYKKKYLKIQIQQINNILKKIPEGS